MNEIMSLMNKICLPVVLIGAINYGLIAIFNTDLLSYLNDGTLIQIAQILIGLSGVGVATGLFGKK